MLWGPFLFSVGNLTKIACSSHAWMSWLPWHACVKSMTALAIQGLQHTETAKKKKKRSPNSFQKCHDLRKCGVHTRVAGVQSCVLTAVLCRLTLIA